MDSSSVTFTPEDQLFRSGLFGQNFEVDNGLTVCRTLSASVV